MFVYPNKLILKTCGTTKLLHSVPIILKIAEDAGLAKVQSFFYSRKSFLYPEQQEWPHGQWNNEVDYLDNVFASEDFETSGYVLGKTNGDHWCLYLCTPYIDSLLDPNGVPYGESEETDKSVDVTLEILMTELDPAYMETFWRTADEKHQSKMEEIKLGKVLKNTFRDQRRVYVFYILIYRMKLGLRIFTPLQKSMITFSIRVDTRLMDC
jgi:S-adenosylmethionine decarboxylase